MQQQQQLFRLLASVEKLQGQRLLPFQLQFLPSFLQQLILLQAVLRKQQSLFLLRALAPQQQVELQVPLQKQPILFLLQAVLYRQQSQQLRQPFHLLASVEKPLKQQLSPSPLQSQPSFLQQQFQLQAVPQMRLIPFQWLALPFEQLFLHLLLT